MNKGRQYIIIPLLILLQTCCWGQYVLKGKVVASASNEGIEGVELFDHNTGQVVITDDTGKYRFEDLLAGTHEITLFKTDYETTTTEVIIQNNFEQDFSLPKLSINLSEIEIASKREELFTIKQLSDIEGTSIFAGKKSEVIVMDLVSGNLANNISRQVYAQIAGLNIYEGNDGGLQLNLGGRGLDPNRTSNFNTRQNGYDISADVLGYPENYYTPPAEAISEIRILRGASSLQYGTQFGGLVDFQLRKIPSFKSLEIRSNQTIGSFGAINSFNSIGLNKGKLSINAFYNYKKGDGYRAFSEYNSNNFFISADYAFSKKTKLTAEFTFFKYLAMQAGGLTDQQFEETPRLSTRERNWFDVDWKLYNLRFDHEFNTSTRISVNFFGLNAERKSLGFRGNPGNLNENPITAIDEQRPDGTYVNPRDLIFGDFRNYGAEFRVLNRYKLFKKNAVFLIGSKIYKSNNASFQGPGSTGDDANFTPKTDLFPDYPSQSNFQFPNFNLALFAENIVYLSDKWSVIPGIRIEHINTEAMGEYNQINFDNAGNPISNVMLSENRDLSRRFALFGLGLNYKKSDQVQFIFNISQNYRSVTFSDIRVVSPTFIVDPAISDEKGYTLDMGINGRVDKFLSYEFTLYSLIYDDRIGIILDERANRVRKNIGKAIIAGTESLINFNIARFITPGERFYKLNLFLNSAFTFSEYLESEENNVVGKKVEFIPTINLKTGISGGYKNLHSSMQFSYVSQQFTDVQNSMIANPNDNRSGIIGEIPSYHILDFTLSYQFKSIKLEFGINNLTNHNYFTRRATGYPGPGIIPSDGRSFYTTVSYML